MIVFLPKAYTKSQITYEVVCDRQAEWDTVSHFAPKRQRSVPVRPAKASVSIVGFKGLSPLIGFEAKPQRNFVHTVCFTPSRN